MYAGHSDELRAEAEVLKGKHVSQDIVIRIYNATGHLGTDLHEKISKFGNIVVALLSLVHQ
jgi:hypothetical protein